ncbi:hypothetical protein [Catenulispora rubra]|uniref:hypothetical protein n=1 Tax=Catenulispora rubra TaxID=280293 RepID=UPI0018924AA2|nr:hypothetical protein [Catenulispora rubra]
MPSSAIPAQAESDFQAFSGTASWPPPAQSNSASLPTQMQFSGLTGQVEAKHLAAILVLAGLLPELETSEATVVNPTG